MAAFSAELMKQSAGDMLKLMQREDLSMPRMVALMFVSRKQCASVSDISEHLNLSLGTTSHIVDQLVEAGFLARHENPNDRRLKHITLTERGRVMVDEIYQVRVAAFTRQIAALPPALVEQFETALAEILAHVRNGALESSQSSEA
ncbi:MAG: MarR family transcriptional regulator [Roseiflexaceae bacterium]